MGNTNSSSPTKQSGFASFLDSATAGLCGNGLADTTHEDEDVILPRKKSLPTRLLESADQMCISSPINAHDRNSGFLDNDDDDSLVEPSSSKMNPTSALFARALVSEVTDNPRTMTPAAMAEREYRLLKAQEAARQKMKNNEVAQQQQDGKPVGAPGGIGQPSILGSLKHALGTSTSQDENVPPSTKKAVLPPTAMSENRAQAAAKANSTSPQGPKGAYGVTIGLSLSRRHAHVGHPDTVTRQTAFDLNELQDRQYKYVSSTDNRGWLAGGGEPGGVPEFTSNDGEPGAKDSKLASPDTIHIPIIHINADSTAAVDTIISALARGEVFIPHMAILPETLSVNGISPPDLVLQFGCDRDYASSSDTPEEWPNWCLEFMHNQLYEYFQNMGAQWMKRPFQITLAQKVRWKTVKHMNRYFCHAERIIDAWREAGPKYLDPQLSYIEGGATPEEVSRPHGIYLMRNGIPTNYFAPNFDPPYSTKMTRSLLLNVLNKSWDKKRREWTSEPVPRLITPSILVGAMCGCSDTQTAGFMASEVTNAVATSPPLSPPVEEYKSLKDYQHLNVAAMRGGGQPTNHHHHHGPIMLDASDLALKEEKKADSEPKDNDEWSPRESSEMASPASRSSPATRAEPPARNASELLNNHSSNKPSSSSRYGVSPSPERGRYTSQGGGSDLGASVVATEATTVHHTNIQTADSASSWLKETLEEETTEDEYDGLDMSTPQQHHVVRNKDARRSSSSAKSMSLLSRNGADGGTTSNGGAPGAKYFMHPKSSGTPPDVQRSDSGTLSLDYSLDSSLLGEGSSLIGPNYATDHSSVNTPTSRATDATYHHHRQVRKNAQQQTTTLYEQQDDETTKTTQDSSSNNSDGPIPSDEDLYHIGWAKALDPNSGSYYYFTLDRSKTVWDNPLLGSVASAASQSTMQSI